MIISPRWAMLLFVVQVVFGRAPCTKETMSDFLLGPNKGDTTMWYWVTQHPQVFRELTLGQWTPGF